MDYNKIEQISKNSELYSAYKKQLEDTKSFIDKFQEFNRVFYQEEIKLEDCNQIMINYSALLSNFQASLQNTEALFTKITLYNEMDKKDLDEFLEIKKVLEKINDSNSYINSLYGKTKSEVTDEKKKNGIFRFIKNRKLNNYSKVIEENYKNNAHAYELLNELTNKLEKKASTMKPAKDGEGISHLRYEQIKEKDGVILIDDKPFNELENMVDQPLGDNISIDDFVLVHATDYYPENHIIKSRRNAGAEKEINIAGKNMAMRDARLTVHFSINGRTASSDFKDKKFVVIEPLKEHIKEFNNIYVTDCFKIDDIKLSEKAILLVKEEAYNELTDTQKSEYNIIKFKGDLTTCVQKTLIMMGIKPQTAHEFGWQNSENENATYKFIEDNYNINKGYYYPRTKTGQYETAMSDRNVSLSEINNQKIDIIDTGISDLTKDEIIKMFNTSKYSKDSTNTKAFQDFLREYGIYQKEGQYGAYSAIGTMNEPLSDEQLKQMTSDFKDELLGNEKSEIEENSSKRR